MEKQDVVENQKPHGASSLEGILTYHKETRHIYTPEFARRVNMVISEFPDDLHVGILILWSEKQRSEQIKLNKYRPVDTEEDREKKAKKIEVIQSLPAAPKAWVEFIQGIDHAEKAKLMEVLRVVVFTGNYFDHHPEKLRIPLKELREFYKKLNRENLRKRDAFIALAFKK